MRRFRDIPIGRKLNIIIALTSGLVVLLACIAFFANDVMIMRRTMANDLTILAKMVGANSSAPVLFADRKAAQETLDFLREQPNILAAAIILPGGEILAQYTRSDSELERLVMQDQTENILYWDDHIDLYSRISMDGEWIGTVFLRSDMSKQHEQLLWYLSIVLAVLLISPFVGLLLSTRLQRLVTDPILTLASIAGQISSDKNYSLRAEKQSNDELGDLFDGFNEMLVEIQARDEELERHGERLEEMVSKRTLELEAVNEELARAKEKAENAARQMTHQAYHDSLTGLPNRTLLLDRLSNAVARAKREDEMLGLLFVDLDRFKLINDSLGHGAGDVLLRAVSERLLGCVRQTDTVARLGGDEFMILLPKLTHAEDAAGVAHKIIDALNRPVPCDGQELHVNASIGISIFPTDGETPTELMRNADAGMYRAKESGSNNIRFYQVAMGTASRERLTLETDLHSALERGELEIYYQPKVATETCEITGVEALLRWRHPDLGSIEPVKFIPLAEETGLIIPIGEWVMHTASAQVREWQENGAPDLGLSVNLSLRQFRERYLQATVRRILQETGLPPNCLELEITESASMQNPDITIETLADLKQLGVRISIDDFGTGYSSLSYLKKLPVDVVKIDRSFVRDIPQDSDDASLARAIIAMAHSLRIAVVAEGVETAEQAAFFQQQGCDLLQGHLFGKPMPAHEFAEILTSQPLSHTARSRHRS